MWLPNNKTVYVPVKLWIWGDSAVVSNSCWAAHWHTKPLALGAKWSTSIYSWETIITPTHPSWRIIWVRLKRQHTFLRRVNCSKHHTKLQHANSLFSSSFTASPDMFCPLAWNWESTIGLLMQRSSSPLVWKTDNFLMHILVGGEKNIYLKYVWIW